MVWSLNAILDGANNENNAVFKFTDTWGTAVIKLKVFAKIDDNQGNNGNCSTTQFIGEQTYTISIRSPKGKAPKLVQTSTQSGNKFKMRYCQTQTLVEIEAFKYADVPGRYSGQEFENYEITLPAGWSSDGRTGTFTTPIRFLNLTIPNGCTESSFTVRAKQNCGSCPTNLSDPATFQIERFPKQLTINTNPGNYVPRCDDTNFVTFTTDDFSCATNYIWILPSGWKGPNGETGNFNGGSTVNIQPNGQNGGTVSAIAVLNCGTNIEGSKVLNNYSIAVAEPVFQNPIQVICGGSSQSYTVQVELGNPRTFIWSTTGSLTLPNGTNSQTFHFDSNQNNHTVVVNAPPSQGYAFSNLTVRALNRCGGESQNTILVGPVHYIRLEGSGNLNTYDVCANQTVIISAVSENGNPNSYNWEVSGGTIISGQGSETLIVQTHSAGQGLHISLFTSSPCGTQQLSRTWAIVSQIDGQNCFEEGFSAFSISPNPAEQQFEIVRKEVSVPEKNIDYEVKILDKTGILVYSQKSKEKKTTVTTKNFKPGIYYVHILHLNGIERKQILVKN